MIVKIEYDKWEDLYNNYMKKDFPNNELYTLNQFLKSKTRKNAYAFIDNGKEKAYMITGETEKVVLIEYLAVYEKYRDKGVGTRFLKEYKEKIENKKLIVLEIEDPDKSKNKQEYEKRVRRKNFYERLGFIVDNRIKEYYFYEYYLLLTTKRDLPIQDVREEILKIYNPVTPDYIMKKFKMVLKETEGNYGN